MHVAINDISLASINYILRLTAEHGKNAAGRAGEFRETRTGRNRIAVETLNREEIRSPKATYASAKSL